MQLKAYKNHRISYYLKRYSTNKTVTLRPKAIFYVKIKKNMEGSSLNVFKDFQAFLKVFQSVKILPCFKNTNVMQLASSQFLNYSNPTSLSAW